MRSKKIDFKRLFPLAISLLILNSIAQIWAAEETTLRYRYAYSADGYNQDRDDVAGSAMTLALFDKLGWEDRLVHFHFNTNFGGKATHAPEHRKSALWTAKLFGFINEINDPNDGYFDVSRSAEEKAAAIEHLANEICRSTSDNPLMLFCAGGVQVPYAALHRALEKNASAESLKAVTFVSHSPANEQTREKGHPEYGVNWSNLIKLSHYPKFIDHSSTLVNGRKDGGPIKRDQNRTAWNTSPRKNMNGVAHWQWLKEYDEPIEGMGFTGTKGEWLLTRLKAAGDPNLGHHGNAEADASDTGLVFGQLPGGNTDADMHDIKVFFMGKSVSAKKNNILFISVDDLNDWIGVMGGHPQAKTPNIDRLAKRGVLFTNAHCQSPVCNPSRTSMMTGLYPESTGIYFLKPALWASPVAAKSTILPQRFHQEGYNVSGAGKLFHNEGNQKYIPNWAGFMGGFGPLPEKKIGPFPGHPLWDWGAYPDQDDKMPDHKIASWAETAFKQKHEQPAFWTLGFLRPHMPQYAPQKWFDMFPLETIQLPKVFQHDLDDLSKYAIDLTREEHVSPTHAWVEANKQWRLLVQSYLACVSFVDHQIGRVLDALDSSPYADNTIIILHSDHGFELGEKKRWGKRSIWQDSTRVPLIIAGPGITQNKVCDKPVELIDIYPTLLDLSDLKSDPMLEGQSLKPLLKNPQADWPHFARSSFGPKNIAITSESYRYIHYNDGSEELYARKTDPNEWFNLINIHELQPTVKQLRAHLPQAYHPVLGEKSTGHNAFTIAN